MLSPISVGILLEVLLLWLAWSLGLAGRSFGFLLAAALLAGSIAGVMLRRRLAAIVAGAVPGLAIMMLMLLSGTSSEGFMMFGAGFMILVGLPMALVGANTAALAWAWRHRPVAGGSAPVRGDGPGTAT